MLGRSTFWLALGGLVWTHAGYPLAVAAAARLRERRVRKNEITPRVTVVVAAWNEEKVIERRVRNLLEQDYPPARFEIVVASDGSTDRTHEIVRSLSAENGRVQLIECERGGKVAAQNQAVRQTDSEILAFSDANATWAPDALRKLVRNFADPEVAYVTGQARLTQPDGTNRETMYWRYEVWLREQESRVGSLTGGYGPVYAVRREDYVEVDPVFGHDLAFPYVMVQRGRRAVYEPEALSFEKPSRDLEDEYRRKVRMFEHCWAITLRGRMFRDLPPGYLAEMISHRLLRYGSGILHAALLASSLALAGRGGVYRLAAAGQLGLLGLAALGRARVRIPGAALAYYYVLVTTATVVALVRYLRSGVPAVWEQAEGTR